jgi:RNA recognition motif-containing protein
VTIYVGNLSYDVTQEDIQQVFADYGTVTKVTMPMDRETGRVRGFGFVEMQSSEEEDKAIEELDGAEWMGRKMRVNKARPKENNNPRGNNKRFQSRF